MAVSEYLIKLSDDFNGSGPVISATLLNTYRAMDHPAYIPNGDARYTIEFYMSGKTRPLEWVFADSDDRDSELALVDEAIAETLSSD